MERLNVWYSPARSLGARSQSAALVRSCRNSARISGTTVRNISEAEQTHEMGQRFVEQQEELADLKEENEYLRARLAVRRPAPPRMHASLHPPSPQQLTRLALHTQDEGVEVGPGAMGADTVHLQRQVADLRAQLAAYQSGMMQMSGTAPMPIPMQTGATGTPTHALGGLKLIWSEVLWMTLQLADAAAVRRRCALAAEGHGHARGAVGAA